MLSNKLASCSLINIFFFFYYFILHILVKALVFLYFSLINLIFCTISYCIFWWKHWFSFLFATLEFCFLLFFYISNNSITLFYKWIKIFDELLTILRFWLLFSYHHILLTHYLLKKNSLWLTHESIKALEIKT